MLIYIYIAPFIPEDPNTLFRLTLSVHRGCTNTHGYTNSHRSPVTSHRDASLCTHSQHTLGKPVLHTLHHISIKEKTKAV